MLRPALACSSLSLGACAPATVLQQSPRPRSLRATSLQPPPAAWLPRRAAPPRPSLRRRGAAWRGVCAAAVPRVPPVVASAPPAPPAPPAPLALDVRDATGSDALQRACAGMRVSAFYVYEGPASGAILFGDAATRDRDAWLDARRRAEEARGGRMAALGMRVTCLAAVARCDALLQEEKAAEGGAPRAWRLLPADAEEVVGTLDVHVGDRLPGELLEGCFPAVAAPLAPPAHAPAEPAALSARAAYRNAPPGAGAVAAAAAAAAAVVAAFDAAFSSGDGDHVLPFAPGVAEPADPDAAAAAAVAAAAAAGKPAGFASAGARAYLFNVCVVPAARRRHVAARLIAAAARAAAQARVRHLYVHVEADNEAARALYARARFAPEAEEPQWLANRLGRPRRLLLRRDLDERDAQEEDDDA